MAVAVNLPDVEAALVVCLQANYWTETGAQVVAQDLAPAVLEALYAAVLWRDPSRGVAVLSGAASLFQSDPPAGQPPK